jgi:dynactin complex subunit
VYKRQGLYRAQARVIAVLSESLRQVRTENTTLHAKLDDMLAQQRSLTYTSKAQEWQINRLERQLKLEQQMHGITKEERDAARQALLIEQAALEAEIATLQQQGKDA